jgi:methyl-accepting chemotaxis protein
MAEFTADRKKGISEVYGYRRAMVIIVKYPAEKRRFMKNMKMGISRKILIFNTIVVTLVVAITALVCIIQFRGELLHQASDSQDTRLKVFWELLKQKGSDIRVQDGKLLVGNYTVNGNFELPDKLKELSGGVATIFMGDERVSTNITSADGKRAIGTKLTGPAYDAIFKQGRAYHGEAVILDEKYFTAYDPIKNTKGEIVGVLFVGVKQSEFMAAFTTVIISIFAITIILLFISGMLNLFFVRQVLRPLKDAAAVVHRVADGDLTLQIEASSEDEVGEVLSSMGKMVQNLRQMIGQMKSSADTMASGSEQLKVSSGKISVNMNAGANQANQIAASAEEMSQTVIDIAKNSSNIAASSSEAAQTARAGEDVVNRSISETEKIAIAVNDSSKMMMTLGERSKEIGAIVEVIKDIADQTNLLALNAAIEAARAGEQGRGFAVVADEVRKLAERTAKSTAQISEMIGAIQKETDKAVDSMRGASERVAAGVSLSQEAGSALSTIVQNVNDLQGMVQQIASATEQMSSVSEHISGDILSIADGTKETSADASSIVQASSNLAQMAQTLKELISKFKV